MIVTKPKFNTFFAIGVFLILSYGSAIYLLSDIMTSAEVSVWMYVLLVLVLIIAFFVTIKMLASYKKVIIDKNRVDVFSLFGLVRRRLYLKELEHWKEESVKTANGTFKQLEVNFANRKTFRIANQEHDNYEKAVNFFRKHYRKNEMKSDSA
ncbi:hypothetical protein OKW21_001156 [Catalinimonas alkaloidigena]|uniref:hypothetical protein n=1 Tax=Catalinimonas alkaloidigena TaxID=1075417 RepID=UPI0024050784|nr:hypothetical protein [Catalinimonas alkaloidigena]MDF9795893.1 hypothetical protein [Catalinimonas alkaloidigena]